MRGNFGISVIMLTGLMALSACDSGDPHLMNIRTDTPDEFGVLPSKPLVQPESYTELPEPTPNGTNLADPTPEADAVAALGGNPDLVTSPQIRAGEQGLISYASRYGVPEDIRDTVATEDLEWRRDHNGRLLERLFNVNVYIKAYAQMALDQHRELARLRGLGVKTPSAPPDPQVQIDN
ncbi:MAG: DUF3035 domain-containing protein [Maritimibacter sp.]